MVSGARVRPTPNRLGGARRAPPTAEMHLALATPTDNPAFTAEAFTTEDLVADAGRIETQILLSLGALERGLFRLTGVAADRGALARQRLHFPTKGGSGTMLRR